MTENDTLSENQTFPKIMGFKEAVKTCFKKYFSFEGCAARAELWWFYLFYLAGLLVLFVATVAAFYFLEALVGMLFLFVLVAFFAAGLLPLYSVLVRRMHDVGLNGILAFIPIAGFVLSLMPSAQESVYRIKKKVHPISGTVGKIFLVLLTLSALNTVVTGIKNFHSGSGREDGEYEYDEGYDYEDYYADDAPSEK